MVGRKTSAGRYHLFLVLSSGSDASCWAWGRHSSPIGSAGSVWLGTEHSGLERMEQGERMNQPKEPGPHPQNQLHLWGILVQQQTRPVSDCVLILVLKQTESEWVLVPVLEWTESGFSLVLVVKQTESGYVLVLVVVPRPALRSGSHPGALPLVSPLGAGGRSNVEPALNSHHAPLLSWNYCSHQPPLLHQAPPPPLCLLAG